MMYTRIPHTLRAALITSWILALSACFQTPAADSQEATPTQPAVTTAQSANTKPSALPKPTPTKTPKTSDIKAPLRFLEVLTGGAQSQDTLPLIVAAHGLGSRPENFRGVYRKAPFKARVIIPYAPTPYGKGFSWFPLSRPLNDPGKHTTGAMQRSARKIADLIRHIRDTRPTQGKTLITGFSQGGLMSYMVAAHHPASADVSLPVAGWLPDSLQPTMPPHKRPYPKIRAFHGTADQVIPLQPTQKMVEAMKTLGMDATLNTYEGVPHSFSAEMHKDYMRALQEALSSDTPAP